MDSEDLVEYLEGFRVLWRLGWMFLQFSEFSEFLEFSDFSENRNSQNTLGS